MIVIGIDPGVNTGLAIYNTKSKQLEEVKTLMIHEAFEEVLSYRALITKVRLEDARLRKHFGNSGREKLQGAGSVKRDCKAWEDFLTAKNIPFELVPPRVIKTKVNEAYFKQLTGIKTRTSNHARDAAMLVWDY